MGPRLAPQLRELLDLDDDARTLGPFKLKKQLGHGGFAPVWLATEGYGGKELRSAAVKLFAVGADGGGEARDSSVARHRARVIEEAQAICRVEHPNVVRFFALAVDDARGIVGLAMEYVAGASLDSRLREHGKLSVSDTLDVGIEVARALHAVHAAGLVHRDVKPANLVESAGVYKLIDFGVSSAEAQVAGAKPSSAKKKVVLDDLPFELVGTKMSMLASAYTVDAKNEDDSPVELIATGTVGYIDPVCVSTGAPAVPASDLYGLGAMLYECLTGKIPALAGARAGTGLRGDVLDGRARAPALRSVDPMIPEMLARLVERLVEPEREARPASAREVGEALQTIRAQLDAMRTRAPKRAVSPWVAVVVGGVLLALTITIAMRPWRAAAPPSASQAAATPSISASVSTTPADCVLGDLDGCTAACNRDQAASCETLAIMYETKNGVTKDLTRARALARESVCGWESSRMLQPRRGGRRIGRLCDGARPLFDRVRRRRHARMQRRRRHALQEARQRRRGRLRGDRSTARSAALRAGLLRRRRLQRRVRKPRCGICERRWREPGFCARRADLRRRVRRRRAHRML
jgi:serine/threonine protein kinase